MKTIKKIFEYELPVSIQKEENGYFAVCPLWQDCYAQGDTIDEVSSEITSVAQSLIDLYKEEGLTIPLKQVKETISTQNNFFTFPVLVSA